MNFRKATLNDVSMILRIKIDAYSHELNLFPHDAYENEITPIYDDSDEIKNIIRCFDYYLIINEDIIIGCFWVHKASDTSVELEDFCISPVYQNKGYGYKALILMESLYPGIDKWILGSPHYNTKNQHLFEKAGFKRIGDSRSSILFLYEKEIVLKETTGENTSSPQITVQDFKKVDLRVCQVVNCMPLKRSKNLLRFDLDDGISGRVVISDMTPLYEPKDLIGKKILVVANIKPSTFYNIKSQGMLLSGDTLQGSPGVVFVDDAIPVGFKIH